MAWTPFRFGLRELRLSKGRAALVAAILGLQASSLSGGMIGFESLFHTRDTHYEELKFADLDVQFAAASSEEMPAMDALARLPGVSAVERRFVSVGHIERGVGADARPLLVVVHYLDPERHPTVDDVAVTRGTFLSPTDADAVLVDRLFAEQHGLSIGDTLVVNPDRFAQHFRVAGIALSPEYLVPTANPDLMVPDKGSLGVLFASRKKLDAMFAEPLYNELVVRYAKGADPATTQASIVSALTAKHVDVERVTPKEGNFGYRYIEEVIGGSRIFMPATAALLAFIAAIAAILSMHRLLVARRRELGALLAHGFTPWQIIQGFLVFGVVPGLAGAVLGIPGGAWLGHNLATSNADVAGMPVPRMDYAPAYFALGGASALVVGVIAVLVPALALTRLTPSSALRGADEIRFAGMPPLLERLLAGSTAMRYAARNIFRRVRLSFATASLVALSVAMPAALLSTLSAWDAWTDGYVGAIRWDVALAFKVPLSDAEVRSTIALRGVVDYEGHLQKHATLIRAGAPDQQMRVRGLPVPTRLSPLDLATGAYFSAPDAAEAIVNTAFAHGAPRAKVGDRVVLVYKGTRRELRVVGTTSDASIQTMYVPLGTAQALFDAEGKVSGASLVLGDGPLPASLVDDGSKVAFVARPEAAEAMDIDTPAMPGPSADPLEGRTDAAAIKRRLLRSEMVTTVQAKSEFREATTRYLQVFHSITVPLIGEGCLLAFFFVASMLSFLMLEREAEYVTLRTMGYGVLDLAKMVLIEVGALAIFGLAMSVGTWVMVSLALLELMNVAWFRIPFAANPHDWTIVAGPIGVFLLLAALPGLRGLARIDLTASTRVRVMG